jgi:hypothetical protein
MAITPNRVALEAYEETYSLKTGVPIFSARFGFDARRALE